MKIWVNINLKQISKEVEKLSISNAVGEKKPVK